MNEKTKRYTQCYQCGRNIFEGLEICPYCKKPTVIKIEPYKEKGFFTKFRKKRNKI